jgi:putative acetyltransferase
VGAVLIRDERPQDADGIHRIHVEAFGGDVEARLVDLLRAAGRSVVSLVAQDPQNPDSLAGHILFSPVTIDGVPPGFRALGLAPVGVTTDCQRQGIGSRLIREGLERCTRDGYDAVVVLGDPQYYSRFGFERASRYGLANEYGVDEEFMVLRLREGALKNDGGTVRYAPEFRSVTS